MKGVGPHCAAVALQLEQGRTVDELATELEITPRHVRRLAKAAGWVPPPRRYLGRRVLKVEVSPEVYAALVARRGRSPEESAAAILELTADAAKLLAEREAAGKGESHAWACGYLDALVARIGGAR